MAELKKFRLEDSLQREQSDKLREMDRSAMRIDTEIKEGRNSFEEYLRKMEKPLDEKELVTETGRRLEKIDIAIKIGDNMRSDIAALTGGLKAKYQELGEIFADAQDYKGFWENMYAKLGLRNKADAVQFKRVAKQGVKENLEQILSYGALVTKKIGEIALVLAGNEKLLLKDIDTTNKIIGDNQPQYEGWRAEREKLEDEVRLAEEKSQQGEQTPEVLLALEEVRRKYSDAKAEEDKYFTVYEKAKHAYPVQRRQLEAIQKIKTDLENYKIAIQEDIKHVTNVYRTVDDNLKAALAAKGAEEFSKAKNVATEMSLKASAWAQKGVADVVAKEAESHLVAPDKLQAITQFMIDTVTDFNSRMEATKGETSQYKLT
jgi:hypothetical protein